MTRTPDPSDDGGGNSLSPTDVYDAMDPLEPYTTPELADYLGRPVKLVRQVLHALSSEERIRKKESSPNRVIWIREPPAHTCPDCSLEFEIKVLHPVLSAVQLCPRCGAQLE